MKAKASKRKAQRVQRKKSRVASSTQELAQKLDEEFQVLFRAPNEKREHDFYLEDVSAERFRSAEEFVRACEKVGVWRLKQGELTEDAGFYIGELVLELAQAVRALIQQGDVMLARRLPRAVEIGARGEGEWFGRKINCRFKTLIVQSENGLNRLHRDFEQIADVEALDAWVRITAFPSYRGFEFTNTYFRADLKAAIREFAPDLVIFDPWNEIARDSMEKDYQEAFELLREVMAEAPNAACLIVHHLRKPRADDKQRGRNLANLLAGSYVLQSKPRCVLVMQPASDDTEDTRVVVTPVKNNDGEYGPRTAWERKASWFEPVPEFNFEEFDSGSSKREPKVNEGHIRELFENGRNTMKKPRAAERLEEIAKVKRSAAYEALKLEGGRFSHLLMEDPDTGRIGLRPTESELPTKAD